MERLRQLLDARRWTRDQAEGLLQLMRERPTVIAWSTVPTTWVNQPAAATPLFGSAAGARATLIDLSSYSEARITAAVTNAGAAGSTLRLYGALATPLTGGAYSAIGAVSMPMAATGVNDSGWLSIPAASRVATYCDILGVGGDGVADPVLGIVQLWLR